MDSQTTLWYRSPATDFDHALPVGNGRIGGMLFGDPEHEVIKLNEDSVWSGGRRERNNPDAYEGLLEIRKLLAEEHIQAAEKIAFEKMQGVTPNARHYMPLGNLEIHQKLQGKARQYCRSLDLEQALAAVQFNVNEVNIFGNCLFPIQTRLWYCTLLPTKRAVFPYPLELTAERTIMTTVAHVHQIPSSIPAVRAESMALALQQP